ncbi:Hemolysin, contains CBS domains [Nocardioides scoriae]|uniref:Hemolysin, contains CBS domains n=1 Tax=Nocardioides scoriae TaxID=642780 RepID=A0A1H1X5B6_9ACTN|nr:hemolysin family protein [Nocardioides scoriae]SDT04555.1 Hemolysin, contains CBS domains [Nocardioides scoriae]
MSPLVVVLVTVLLIVFSALFVAAEFALLAVKRHRLQDNAGSSRSARAALRSFDELTVLLAGCQLGITAAALGLGAVTKPALDHTLTPVFEGWGAPGWLAGTLGFVLALLLVTFLHLVVGEMAPKSWAIAHPETAATALALPMRAFMFVTRPLLVALNSAANWCLRRVGVEPQDSPHTGQSADDLRHLVEHSVDAGTLDTHRSTQLTRALELQHLTVGDLVRPGDRAAAVTVDQDMTAVREVTRTSGHLRVLVRQGGRVLGAVHVRDTMQEPDDRAAGEVMRAVAHLETETTLHEALTTMRQLRQHLAVVEDDGVPVGVVTLTDIVRRLFPVELDAA